MAINASPLKPEQWRRFVDDTNFIWPHERDSLDELIKRTKKSIGRYKIHNGN
jgi:hypothetical protein